MYNRGDMSNIHSGYSNMNVIHVLKIEPVLAARTVAQPLTPMPTIHPISQEGLAFCSDSSFTRNKDCRNQVMDKDSGEEKKREAMAAMMKQQEGLVSKRNNLGKIEASHMHKAHKKRRALGFRALSLVIMEYLVKISKKERILELKRRNMKKTDSDIQYAVSIKEDTTYLCLHFTKDHEGNKINTPYPENPIRRIQAMEIKYSGRYRTWSLLQETPNTPYRRFSIRRIDLFPGLINKKLKNEF
ncbi:hypothetical protein Tco_0386650 [Tanacetum coccineum]